MNTSLTEPRVEIDDNHLTDPDDSKITRSPVAQVNGDETKNGQNTESQQSSVSSSNTTAKETSFQSLKKRKSVKFNEIISDNFKSLESHRRNEESATGVSTPPRVSMIVGRQTSRMKRGLRNFFD